MDAYRQYKIDEFNIEGKTVAAETNLNFTETPALMTFFINRVNFENGEPVKDCTPFQFEKKIFLSKKNTKKNSVVREKVDACDN